VQRCEIWDCSASHFRGSFLFANVVTGQLFKFAFGILPKLIVMGSFFADHDFAAAVPRVEPLGRGSAAAIRAIETRPRSHLDEWPSLRQLSRLFVLHSNPCSTLTVPEHVNRADKDFVASLRFAHGMPVTSGENHQTGENDRGQYDAD
jgi:hypothetical protein